MWAKNLLFLAIATGGAAILAANFVPPVRAPRGEQPRSVIATPDKALAAAARLDRAMAVAWSETGVEPAPVADELLVARRLSLALAGTIPSLEEIRQIESQPLALRRAFWIEHLLSDRRWSDYMAERLARAFVGVENGPFLVYRRRRFVTWLADRLHAGVPYDEIVRELISSDGLWTDRPATNFITVAMRPDAADGLDADQLATRTARAMLGVRLDCAQCHDHPFAEWRQADFQALAAFFADARTSLVGLDDSRTRAPGKQDDAMDAPLIAAAVPFLPNLLPAEGDRRQRLAAWVTHPQNEAFARATANRLWALLFGQPLVEPLDDLPPHGAAHPALDVLAQDLVESDFDLRHMIRTIGLSTTFALTSDGAEEAIDGACAWTVFPVTPLRAEQVAGAITQATSLETIDYESQFLVRFARNVQLGEFVARHGDRGEQELEPAASTIPQRLLSMNGKLVGEATKHQFNGAPARIASLAPDARTAVEVAFLAVLTRRPTAEELVFFLSQFDESQDHPREALVEDLYWSLFNSTEFAWNH